MASCRYRLDRFIAQHAAFSRRDVRLLLAQRRITIDGEVAVDITQPVGPFSLVTLDHVVLQQQQPLYLAMNKPVGVVSATYDNEHTTVIDQLRHSTECPLEPAQLEQLHIVGRLDRASSGLLLLTNDSLWSQRLMAPEHKVAKVYHVTLAHPVNADYITAFAAGMYFPFENITTRPALLEIIAEREVLVTLMEGRYHQIKRMFGRFRNPVLGLHRLSIGQWQLPPDSWPGQSWQLAIKS
ncbi:pseudouridine synthase [Oceanobacter antarcticus]|jgi:16S rRNA pseudouridine516 synthase|uniref:Pseudouridine synthase n=1 Tax=Oceanobacter antarcticus TaxID=3133425 RepID=A0ABW8NIJ6_9GAMM